MITFSLFDKFRLTGFFYYLLLVFFVITYLLTYLDFSLLLLTQFCLKGLGINYDNQQLFAFYKGRFSACVARSFYGYF